MHSDPPFHDEEEKKLTSCTWCGGVLGNNVLPRGSAIVFCSRRCEIEANYWLYREMCVIEITHPLQSAGEQCDSP